MRLRFADVSGLCGTNPLTQFSTFSLLTINLTLWFTSEIHGRRCSKRRVLLGQRFYPGICDHFLGAAYRSYLIPILLNYVQVEDRLFCVPRYEFVQSSEVFAGLFLLPSGPVAHAEGQDREHPIVLEGYQKDEFACLLKVMYPAYV